MNETSPAEPNAGGSTKSRKLQVWDLPLRLFHWTLLVLVAGAILSVELGDTLSGAMEWHPRFGYAILALLVFRLIWGLLGGTHARFINFVRGPRSVLDYLRNLKSRSVPTIGHNPLGAWSVLALLASLLFQVGSGLFLNDEDVYIEAPLFKYVSNDVVHTLRKLHEANASLLFVLIGLHICAIVYYRFVKRDNLITPMVTGKKVVNADLPVEDARGGNGWLGLGIFAVVAVAVYVFVTQA
jgi:cytochrome b